MSSVFETILGGIVPARWDCEFSPPCSEWLAGRSHEEPNHLCWQCAAKSVGEFLTHWGLITENSPPYLNTWPLPLGQHAINKWAFSRAPMEIKGVDGFLSLPDIDPAGFLKIAIDGPPIHPLVAAIVTDPEAWLVAVAHRQLEAGQVWMLGTGRQIGMKWRAPLAGYVIYYWNHNVERMQEAGENSEEPHYVEYVWGSGFPHMMTMSVGGGGEDSRVFVGDRNRMKLSPLKDLDQESRRLAAWWNRRQLKLTNPGRPVGTKEGWRDKEHFLTTVESAIVAIAARKDPVTQARVADELYRRGYLSSRRGSRGEDVERQFKRDRKDYGYTNWEALKKACMK